MRNFFECLPPIVIQQNYVMNASLYSCCQDFVLQSKSKYFTRGIQTMDIFSTSIVTLETEVDALQHRPRTAAANTTNGAILTYSLLSNFTTTIVNDRNMTKGSMSRYTLLSYYDRLISLMENTTKGCMSTYVIQTPKYRYFVEPMSRYTLLSYYNLSFVKKCLRCIRPAILRMVDLWDLGPSSLERACVLLTWDQAIA